MKRNHENNNSHNIKKPINPFSFMMTNRHKQDEAIKEITEKISNAMTEEDNSDSDESICLLQKQTLKERNLPLLNIKGSSNGVSNAFQYLMCNRIKDKHSEDEDNLSYDSSSPVKNKGKGKKKSRNIKIKVPCKTKNNNSSDESMDNFDESSNNVQKSFLESKSQQNKDNRILISPSDSKSKLINENEYFDIEETFKEEIKECFSEKKKKNKRIKTKPKSTNDKSSPCVMNDQLVNTFENESEPADRNQENKNLKVISSQPGIKFFFKPSSNGQQKENITLISKPSIIQNTEIIKVFNDTKDNLNGILTSKTNIKCEMKVTSDNFDEKKYEKCSKSSDSVNKASDRPTCLKKKTKSLRNIRILKSESTVKELPLIQSIESNTNNELNNSISDFKTDTEKDLKLGRCSRTKNKKESHFQSQSQESCTTDENESHLQSQHQESCTSEENDDSDSDFKPVKRNLKIKRSSRKCNKMKFQKQCNNYENDNSNSDIKSNLESDLMLRRSSRAIKKPQTFEIFDNSKENRIKKKKNNAKENLDFSFDKNLKSKKVLHDNYTDKKKKKKNSRKSITSSAKESDHQNSKKERRKMSKADKQNKKKSACTSEPDIIILDSPDNSADKKASQLAPIFMKKKKIAISPTKLKARTEFLFSDVPENLKKFSMKCIEEQNMICPFPKYSHTRQDDDSEYYWNLAEPEILCLNREFELSTPSKCDEHFKIISSKKSHSGISQEPLTSFPVLSSSTVCHILAYLKSKIECFPVISVYNSFIQSKKEHIHFYEKEFAKEALNIQRSFLRKEINSNLTDRGSPLKENKISKRKKKAKRANKNKRRKLTDDSLVDCEEDAEEDAIWHKSVPYEWTQVFTPKSAEHIIGNLGPISKLKEFLTKWRSALNSDNHTDKGSNGNLSDDSCDTYEKVSIVNAMLITGPSGIGKTASVYTVAQDLGYKVLEINASSSRQGKELMSQLSEATQSHNVRTVGSNQTLLSSSDQVTTIIDSADKGKSMSLILIEDIDIVFEEADEGFWSAVNSLLCTSKRPIIMTSSIDATYPIPKIKEQYDDIEFFSPNPEHTAQYLQLLCLANGVFTCLKEIELLVKSNNNDIRKSIVDLQLWILSGKCHVQWWKVDNELNLSNALKHQKSNDVNILKIFPSAEKMSCKSVEIPICLGSIWSKSDAMSIKNPARLSNRKATLDWTLLSANFDIVLPFLKREREKQKLKYPLQKDDPELRRHSLWQKHSWLSIDDESDSEKEPLEVTEKNTNEKPQLPDQVKKCVYSCVTKLSNFLSSFADFDILSCSSHLSQEEYPYEFYRNWWTPVIFDGLESNPNNFSLPYYDLNSTLIPDLSELNLKSVQNSLLKSIESLNIKEEILPLCLEVPQRSPLILSPHCRLPVRKRKVIEELHQSLSSELSPQIQLNRYSLVMDYLPALRDIARVDHVGEAIQQFKRSRRILKYFDHLQIDNLSKTNLIDLCNLFQAI